MASKKRKKPHKCKNHPNRSARGRCAKCRKWICRECASQRKGLFFCKDTCLNEKEPEKKTTIKTDKEIPPEEKNVKEKSKKSKIEFDFRTPMMIIVSLACLTIGLSGITYGLIQYRKTFELEEQIQLYKSNRDRMVKFIKRRNTQYRELRKRINEGNQEGEKEVKSEEDTTVEVERKVKPEIFSQQEYSYISLKLPVSFDNGTTDKKLIALTFDGGAYANAADDILDTLMSRGVSSTMFLTGRFIRKNPELVQRIIIEGHEVGNHTSTHPHLTSWADTRSHTTLPEVTNVMIGKELKDANIYFKKLIGYDMRPLWRAPYGEKNRLICLWAQQHGYLHIGWKQARTWRNNFDTNDWVPDPETPGYHTPGEILEKFNYFADAQPYGMNGAIILMHMGTKRKEKDKMVHYALGKIIDQLREKGYEFVTVTVLLRESEVDLSLLKNR